MGFPEKKKKIVDFAFDFEKGTINHQPVLNARLFVHNGKVINETSFRPDGKFFLEIILSDAGKNPGEQRITPGSLVVFSSAVLRTVVPFLRLYSSHHQRSLTQQTLC